MDLDLLTALAGAHGPSGQEDRVREIVRAQLAPVVDRVEVDPLGNLTAWRGGDGPRVMLAAHMDEIGLMVTHVDDRGFLRVIPIGGWDALAGAKHGTWNLPVECPELGRPREDAGQ